MSDRSSGTPRPAPMPANAPEREEQVAAALGHVLDIALGIEVEIVADVAELVVVAVAVVAFAITLFKAAFCCMVPPLTLNISELLPHV